jgi:hypothetical protein
MQKGYIGRTSPGTQIGNVVYIFAVSITTFILLKSLELRTWTLVCKVNVHSLMYGEGIKKGKRESTMLNR